MNNLSTTVLVLLLFTVPSTALHRFSDNVEASRSPGSSLVSLSDLNGALFRVQFDRGPIDEYFINLLGDYTNLTRSWPDFIYFHADDDPVSCGYISWYNIVDSNFVTINDVLIDAHWYNGTRFAAILSWRHYAKMTLDLKRVNSSFFQGFLRYTVSSFRRSMKTTLTYVKGPDLKITPCTSPVRVAPPASPGPDSDLHPQGDGIAEVLWWWESSWWTLRTYYMPIGFCVAEVAHTTGRCLCDYPAFFAPMTFEQTDGSCMAMPRQYVRSGGDPSENVINPLAAYGSQENPHASLTSAVQFSLRGSSISYYRHNSAYVSDMYVMEELYLLPGVYLPATDPMLFIPEATSLTSITSSHGAGATVLDCEYRSQGLVIESTHTAFSNLTIRNCRGLFDSDADLPAPLGFHAEDHRHLQGSGGAVLLLKGRLQMENCVIEGCRASAYGGGIAVVGVTDAGTVSLKAVLFSHNHGVCGGGALATLCETGAESTSIVITQSMFRHNLAQTGGAVYTTCSLLSVNHSHFEYNSAESLGGAIFSFTEQAVGVSDSIFEHNIATHRVNAAEFCPGIQEEWFTGTPFHASEGRSSTRGGGIAVLVASLHVSTTRFINCSAELGGALSIMGGAPEGRSGHHIVIDSCMLQKNTAGLDGGAVWILDTPTSVSLRMQHVLCVDNRAVTGACLSLGGTGIFSAMNTSLVWNQAYTAGGGIAVTGYVSVELSGLRFLSNSAGAHGGALSCEGAGLIKDHASLYANNTAAAGGRGGALSLSDVCSGALEEIVLADNTAGKFGGALYSSVIGAGSTLTLQRVQFVRNGAKHMGGAMFTDQRRDSMMLVELSFLENYVEQGGGGAVVSQAVSPCINCTVSGNVAHFAEDFMTTDLHLVMLDAYNDSNSHAISGVAMPPFEMQLVDEYGSLIQAVHSEHACQALMSAEADAAQIEGNEECIEEGVAMFDELKLFAFPNSSVNISITAYAVLPGNWEQVSSAANFTVMLEACQDSEGLSQDLLVCEVCHTKNGYATGPSEPCVLCGKHQTVDDFQCKDLAEFNYRPIIIMAITLGSVACMVALFGLVRTKVAQHNLRHEEMRHKLDQFKFKQRENLIFNGNRAFIDQHLKSKFAAVASALELLLPESGQYHTAALEDDSSSTHSSGTSVNDMKSMDILMSCRQELINGFEICNTAQLCGQILQGLYVVDIVPCNIEALLAEEFQDKLEVCVEGMETCIDIDPYLIKSMVHLAYNEILRYPGSIPTLQVKIVELAGDVVELGMLLRRTFVQGTNDRMPYAVLNQMSEDAASLMMQQICKAMITYLTGEFKFELCDNHVQCNFRACGVRSSEASRSQPKQICTRMDDEWHHDHYQDVQRVTDQVLCAEVLVDIDHAALPECNSSTSELSDEEIHRISGLRYAVCDVCGLSLSVFKKFITKTLRGSPSSLFMGTTREEILAFADVVLNSQPPIDICFLDHTLDDPYTCCGLPIMLGTDIIQMMTSRGYKGMIIMRVADNSPANVKRYMDVGADGILVKTWDMQMSAMMINRLWNYKQRSTDIMQMMTSSDYK